MKLFILWTTFICSNGTPPTYEMQKRGFIRNMYSTKVYTELEFEKMNQQKDEWRRIYSGGRCSAFLIQHEEINDKIILKDIMGLYL